MLTTSEKRKGARDFVAHHFERLNETGNLNTDDIEAAFEAVVLNFIRGSTPGGATQNMKAYYNSLLTEPFKSKATPAQKATLLAGAALFEAGRL